MIAVAIQAMTFAAMIVVFFMLMALADAGRSGFEDAR
jgi:hypothetical protein